MRLKKQAVFALVLLVLLVPVLLWGGLSRPGAVLTFYPSAFRDTLVIIDAGHGGEDGGAVSLSGASESQINLAVALRTDQVLGLFGVPVLLLREEDVSLHSEGASTLRQKKSSDLHNRVAAIEAQNNAVLLSIHQNSYPNPRYSGAQVFYAPTDGSQVLAETMQTVLREGLDPSNGRQIKCIPDTIYLMNHISCPAVLVECGFLTNPQEEQLLLTEGYQTKLAAVLAGGYLRHRNS